MRIEVDSTHRVRELREAFDRTFARPVRPEPPQTVELLTLRLAEQIYAIDLKEIAELSAEFRLLPLPSAVPSFLGITALRGSIIPVYSLAALLGYAVEPARKWLAVSPGREPVGLAFFAYEGHRRVPVSELILPSSPETGVGEHEHIWALARTSEGMRSIVNVLALLAGIERAVQPNGRAKGA